MQFCEYAGIIVAWILIYAFVILPEYREWKKRNDNGFNLTPKVNDERM